MCLLITCVGHIAQIWRYSSAYKFPRSLFARRGDASQLCRADKKEMLVASDRRKGVISVAKAARPSRRRYQGRERLHRGRFVEASRRDHRYALLLRADDAFAREWDRVARSSGGNAELLVSGILR